MELLLALVFLCLLVKVLGTILFAIVRVLAFLLGNIFNFAGAFLKVAVGIFIFAISLNIISVAVEHTDSTFPALGIIVVLIILLIYFVNTSEKKERDK